MKRTAISLVLVLILALLLPASAAGDSQKGGPDKLRIDNVTYTSSQLQFNVHLSCKPGIANTAEHFGYRVRTKLTITNFIPVVLEGEEDLIELEVTEKGRGGYAAIEPIQLPYNPYLSACSVTVEAVIVDAEGTVVGETATYQGWVETGLPGGI